MKILTVCEGFCPLILLSPQARAWENREFTVQDGQSEKAGMDRRGS
jgi:hypothetical protein